MKIKNKQKLENQYSGKNAKQYDDIRKVSERHIMEELIIRKYIMEVKPKTIIDCPCGTMRWIDIYADSGSIILGVDLSEDMLEQAISKVRAKGLKEKIEFLQADVMNNFELEKHYDLVLCVRFINWVSIKMAYKVITSLNRNANLYFLLGCTVLPNDWSLLNKLIAKYLLYKDNKKRIKRKLAKRYVHKEQKIKRFMDSLGWDISEKGVTMENKDGVNYLYLFKKI